MASAGEVALRYTADLQAFQAELAKMPGITATVTRNAVTRYNAEWGKVNGSAPAVKATASIAKELKTAAPMLTAATGQMGSLAGAALSLGPAGVAAALAIGAVSIAAKAWGEDGERAAATAARVEAAHKAMGAIAGDTRLKLIDLALATGVLTEAEAAHATIGIKALGAWHTATADTLKRQRELTAANAGWSAAIGDAGERLGEYVGRLNPTVKLIDAFTRSTSENREEQAALDAVIAESIETLRKNREATESLTKAALDHAAAVRAQKKAENELKALLKGIADDQAAASATEKAEVEAWNARNAVRVQKETDFHQLIMDETKENDALEEWAAEREVERQKESAASTSSSLGSLSGSFASLADSMAETDKDAAYQMWLLSKAAAAAQVAVQAPAAIAAAWTLGPIVGSIASVAVGVEFAALAAEVASSQPPSFPRGGMMPDHRAILARDDESVLNSRATAAMGGKRGIDALNSGTTSGAATSSAVLAVPVFRQTRRFFTDELRRTGSPLAREIAQAARRTGKVGW